MNPAPRPGQPLGAFGPRPREPLGASGSHGKRATPASPAEVQVGAPLTGAVTAADALIDAMAVRARLAQRQAARNVVKIANSRGFLGITTSTG